MLCISFSSKSNGIHMLKIVNCWNFLIFFWEGTGGFEKLSGLRISSIFDRRCLKNVLKRPWFKNTPSGQEFTLLPFTPPPRVSPWCFFLEAPLEPPPPPVEGPLKFTFFSQNPIFHDQNFRGPPAGGGGGGSRIWGPSKKKHHEFHNKQSLSPARFTTCRGAFSNPARLLQTEISF